MHHTNKKLSIKIFVRGSVWFGPVLKNQSKIRSEQFSQKDIQTHLIIFGFVQFPNFLERFGLKHP